MNLNIDKNFDDIYELLQVIYPPNKPVTALNVEKLLELADEYQMIELNKRCRTFLLQQRGMCIYQLHKYSNRRFLFNLKNF